MGGILMTSGLDEGAVTEVIDLVKNVMTLFKEFPLNLMLVATLAGIGFALFRKARGAAGGI